MRPQKDQESHPPAPPPVALEYAPKTERRGFTVSASRFASSLGKPISMGRLYVIMFVLSLLATIIVVIVIALFEAIE